MFNCYWLEVVLSVDRLESTGIKCSQNMSESIHVIVYEICALREL
jgi:hypothetical protein